MRQVTGKVPSIRESDPRVRLAVLGNEPMIHPDRFGELVARNRGADARVFTVEAEALAWVRRLR